MGAPAVGDVVLVAFPHSALGERKLRPAFVAAEADRGDLILCQITSRSYRSATALPLPEGAGGLQRASYLRPDKLFTADPRLIVRRIGKLDKSQVSIARSAIALLFA